MISKLGKFMQLVSDGMTITEISKEIDWTMLLQANILKPTSSKMS
jgi:hypothetical protein